MKQMKVLHIVPRYIAAGAERLVLAYAQELPKRGIDVAVTNTWADGGLGPSFYKTDAAVQTLDATSIFGRLVAAFRVIQFAKKQQPDIIHTHLFGADVFGWVLSILIPRVRWVSTQHNVETHASVIRRMIWKRLLRRADRVTAVAPAVADFARAVFRIPEHKLITIQNGIRLAQWQAVPQLTAHEGAVQFATIGRLTAQKGHADLFHALAKVEGDWQLHVYGDGELWGVLAELADELDITAQVTFHGAVHDLPERLAEIDVVVQPSHWEGLSLVAMETMAAGRVLVGTPPVMRDVVVDERMGKTVPVDDVEALRETLQWCVSHQHELPLIGKRARGHALRHFGLKRHVEELVAVYETLI